MSKWILAGRYWVRVGDGFRLPVIQGGGPANTVQNDVYAFGDDDGSATTHTLDTENTNRDAQAVDVTFMIRIQVEETAGGTDNLTAALFAQKNGTGGFVQVPYSATNNGLRLADDTQSRADDELLTTQRLTAGGSGYSQGRYDDGTGAVGTSAVSLDADGNGVTEFEFAILIDSANATNGDYWELRVEWTSGTDLDGYPASYPTVTANIGATVHEGAADLAGSGTLAAAGAKSTFGAIDTAGSGTIEAAGQVIKYAASDLVGSGSLAAAGLVTKYGTIDFSGAATVGADAALIASGELDLSGSGLVSASGTIIGVEPTAHEGTANFVGSGSISATATLYHGVIIDIDHEDGDLSQYTSTSTGGGELSVESYAALAGTNYGIKIFTDNLNVLTGTKELLSPNTSGIIRARFYFDVNGLTTVNTLFNLLYLRNSSDQILGIVRFYDNNTAFRINSGAYDDSNTAHDTSLYVITDEPHYIETKLVRASNESSGDGYWQLWIDGDLKQTVSDIDNYDRFTNFENLIFGATGIDAGTSGTIYLDELIVNDNGSEIGPVAQIHQGEAALSGTGILAADSELIASGELSLDGSGILSADGIRNRSGDLAISGSGVVSGAAVLKLSAALPLSGTGTLSGSGSVSGLQEGEASLSGSGTLAADGVIKKSGAISLSGTGTIIASGSVAGTVDGEADLSGSGLLAANGVVNKSGQLGLSGSGILAADGTRIKIGAMSLSGSGVISGAGVSTIGGVLAISGSGLLAGDVNITLSGALLLSGTGTLVGSATVISAPTAAVATMTIGDSIVTALAIDDQVVTSMALSDAIVTNTATADEVG